ncbi:TBC1 domain family member 5, partial [Lecanoromycetidae sp. Uapishka_2]
MRSISETRARWEATLANRSGLSDLRKAIKDSNKQNPCLNGLRSICWKVFLLFKTLDKPAWVKTLHDSRSAYTSLREHFLKNLENPDDLSAEDPLTDTETSPWNTLRQDEELRAEIFQDVERCMPENLYFREPPTQNMLLDILFIYCKLNKDIGYRQGMHEVLAPIVWVVSRDAIDPRTLGDQRAVLDDAMVLNLDQNYVEHDAFTLFGAIMQTVKSFYETGSVNEPTTSGLLNNSPIVERSKRIHEKYLHHADPELAEHMTAIEILPQIFLIRWVRLLFGREFPFEDVLALWDILFAEDPGLELVDLVSVSMLLRIRWQLLEADYSAALTLLLRYPVPLPPHGPPTFVSDALYLRDNLLLDGGDHIISKYSRRAPETTVTRKLPKKVKRARTAEQAAAQKAISPRLTPARIFQDQGGIEGIIHEAAKGVYSQGEKWGVGKALRGAVQGLQAANTSPRLQHKSRWSLDTGKMITDKPMDMIAKIEALEARNMSLAKLLESSVNELWIQQKDIHQKDEAAAEALSVSIAKLQFVQVYLDNSAMPLPTESSPADGAEANPTLTAPTTLLHSPQTDEAIEPNSSTSDSREPSAHPVPGSATIPSLPSPSTPKISSPPNASNPKQSSLSRPTLAQSPFSWMLGEEQPKSSFVSNSPSRPDSRDFKGKSNLFGESAREDNTNRISSNSKANGEMSAEDGDVFTMGTLRDRLGH